MLLTRKVNWYEIGDTIRLKPPAIPGIPDKKSPGEPAKGTEKP
jgi:hypothetical protein